MGVRQGIYKNCLKCKKEFYIYPYLVSTTSEPKYCSRKCCEKGEVRVCGTCEKSFYALPGSIKRGWGKFCSHSCSSKSRDNTVYLGKYAQKGAPIPKMAFKPKGLTFKGTHAEYKKLHYQIGLRLGKPKQCSSCEGLFTGRQIDWANKSGEYRETPDDWIRLCKKCHWNYDRQFERMIA